MLARRRSMPGLRAVALAVAVSVLVQDAALAAGPEIWRASAPSAAILPSSDGPGQGAPERWGHTTHRRRFKDSELIINIQDSHANLDAQSSIGRVLDEFGAAYNIELIGLEGSAGRMDTDLVAEFPDERVRGDVAEGLLKKTMISAAEYRNILQGGGAELFGVEDARLYRRNVRDYQKLLFIRADAQEQLSRVRRALEPRDQAELPVVVPVIHRMSVDHAEGRLKFADYWERMSREAASAGVKPSGYDAIASLAKALELERSIDFAAAAAERGTLIQALKGNLPVSERARFVKELVLFKTGKMRAAQMHRTLLERARKFLPDTPAPELTKYAAYLALYEKIDLAALFIQIRSFERELIAALLTGPGQRDAYARMEMLDLLERLFDGELTPDDYGRYLGLRSAVGLGALRARAGEGSGTDWALLARAERTARGFYGRVEARNRAMIGRLTARMREKGVRTAALVTGGFHAEGLSKLMERDRISHVVVLPHFDAGGPERPYAAVITSKGSYLDRSIRTAALAEVIALAVWSASVQGVSVPRAKAVLERNARKIVRRRLSERRSAYPASSKSVSSQAPDPGPGRAADRWIGTASVLAGIDADLAVQMVRTAEVNGDRIRVGGFEFKGSADVSTSGSGVRRRKASVRLTGRAQESPAALTDVAPMPAVSDRSDRTEERAADFAQAIRSAGDRMRQYSGKFTDAGRLNAEFDALVGMTLRKKGLDPDRMPRAARELADRVRASSVGHVIASRRASGTPPAAIAAARMAEPSRAERRTRQAREREEAKTGVSRERGTSSEHHWIWTDSGSRTLEIERFDPASDRAADRMGWIKAPLVWLGAFLRWMGLLDPEATPWKIGGAGSARGAMEGHAAVHFKVLRGPERELRGYVVLDVETDDGEVAGVQALGFVMPGASQLRPTLLESLVETDVRGMAWAAEDFLNGLVFKEAIRAGARLAGQQPVFRPAYIDYSASPAGTAARPSGSRMSAMPLTPARLRSVVALRGITDHSADDKEFNFMILSAQLQNYLAQTHQRALSEHASDWHDQVTARLQKLEARIKLNRRSKDPVKETLAGLDRMIDSTGLLLAQAEKSLKKKDRDVRAETLKRIRRIHRLLETRKDYVLKRVALEPVDLQEVLKKYGNKLIDRLPKQLEAPKRSDYRITVRKAPGTHYRDLWIDPMAVKRIMAEVVRNAFKYGAHRVVVRLDRSGDRVTVRFEDDGPGIPAELLEKGQLFRYGVTTGGTGLGLYEARELARSHGGDLTAVNLKSKGAALILTLNAAQPSAARMAALPEQAMLAFSMGEFFTPGFFITLAVMTGIAALVRAALTAKHPTAGKTRRSAASSPAASSVPRPSSKSRPILSIFVYGPLLALAAMAFETWYFSKHRTTPLKAEYELLSGQDPIPARPRGVTPAAGFDMIEADRAGR